MTNGSAVQASPDNDGITPVIVEGRRMLIAGVAERHIGINTGISDQWRRFASRIAEIPDQVDAATYGVIFDSLKSARSFGYLSGIEVSGVARLPAGMGHLELPAQRYAVFTHRDHVSALPRTMHAIMNEWLPKSGFERVLDGADFFERYGNEFDPRTGAGAVELWIPIKA